MGVDLEIEVSFVDQFPEVHYSLASPARITYHRPIVREIQPATGFKTIGGDDVSVFGSNFGPVGFGATREVLIGGQPCAGTALISDAEIQCIGTPANTGTDHDVTVIIAGQTGSKQSLFSCVPMSLASRRGKIEP